MPPMCWESGTHLPVQLFTNCLVEGLGLSDKNLIMFFCIIYAFYALSVFSLLTLFSFFIHLELHHPGIGFVRSVSWDCLLPFLLCPAVLTSSLNGTWLCHGQALVCIRLCP